MPFTLPVASTVAMLLSDEVHTPPAVASVNCVEEPTHIFTVPEMTDTTGNAFTVIVTALVLVQEVEVTVTL